MLKTVFSLKYYSELLPALAPREVINVVLLILVLFVGYSASVATNPGYTHNHLTGFSPDTNLVDTASTNADTMPKPAKPKSSSPLKSKVEYSAVDSMRFDIQEQKMYLYGEATVDYETINLEAEYIEMDLKNSLLFAMGVEDSTGTPQGRPVFKDGDQLFKCDTIRYNFETKKGKIHEAITQEGDGYIHGKEVKRFDENVLYIKNGKYTTCSLEDPHFYIQAGKLKIIKDKKIITGPAYLKVADVPTPLAVPFGFFPNKKGQSSGIVMPTYGESPTLGFYLTNGGYYFAINDYMNLRLTGDIYSRGSWGGTAHSDYNVRYKASGALNVSYSELRQSDPEFPDFSRTTSFFVKWRHKQDPKARPNSIFSADVNAGSSNNFRNNFQSSTNDYLTNNFNSNISFSKSFPGKPFAFTLNGSHSQNTSDSSISITLPQATFTVSRLTAKKLFNIKTVGRDKWWHKIGFSLTSKAKNTVSVKEDSLFTQYALDRMRNGVTHAIPINTSFKLGSGKIIKGNPMQYFTLNPSINMSETWYLETIEKRWFSDSLITDTMQGFDRFFQAGLSASLSTKLYGTYTFKESSAIRGIRHVITPSASFTYKPDYSQPKYGFFDSVQVDTNGNIQQYSIFDNNIGIYGRPATSQAGVLNLSLQNTLHMKVRSEKDTINNEKKIAIFEAFNFSSSYNIFADSLNWSPVRINARTNLGKGFNVRFTSTLDPYAIDLKTGNRVNQLQFNKSIQKYGYWDLARLTELSVALGLNLKSKNSPTGPKTSDKGTEEELAAINANPDAYVDFNVPWSLNISHNLRYSKLQFDAQLTNSFSVNGDVRLTENWKIGFSSGYDFKTDQITITTIDIYRDLHCWEMKFNVVPFGERQRYQVDIKVKSSVLQDLKLTRKRNWYDYQ